MVERIQGIFGIIIYSLKNSIGYDQVMFIWENLKVCRLDGLFERTWEFWEFSFLSSVFIPVGTKNQSLIIKQKHKQKLRAPAVESLAHWCYDERELFVLLGIEFYILALEINIITTKPV